jgi:Domain of unknown function (DUF4288)
MGWIPKDAEWYLADIVEQITVEGDPRSVVHTNMVLVSANSPEEAYEKALQLGKELEQVYDNIDGKRVECHFRGLGTDQRLGVSFDQQDGSAVGGWTEYGVIGAYAHTARHAVKCAEWCRTQDVAWRSSPRTGRAGFRLR